MVAWNTPATSGDELIAQVMTDALAVLHQLEGDVRKVDLERTVEVGDKRVSCRLVIEERGGAE